MEIWYFLGFCAFVGIFWVILQKIGQKLFNPAAWLLSWFILGVVAGVALWGFLAIADFLEICNGTEIFGISAFWVGFVPMTLWQMYKTIKYRC